jgi:Carboxypeptidase regulatory-like domain
MAKATLTSSTPATRPTAPAPRSGLVAGLSLSQVQAMVGTLAGLASIIGVAFSLLQVTRPANTGELVTIVQAAGSTTRVAGATIEVLNTQDALVATLTPDATGRAAQELKEGVYVVRVSHPRYAAEARRIQVVPGQTTEIRTNLRAGSSSPVERAVNNGVSAVKKALRF